MLWRVSWSRQAVAIKDSVDFVRAGKSIGMSSHFTDQVAAMGTDGAHPNNYERDFLAFARRDLGVDFQLYDVNCFVRKRGQAAVNMDIGFLLPYEVAHWLWMFNPENVAVLFDKARIIIFWEKTIERNEVWWRRHPLREAIIAAPDRSNYLPIRLFGDDGCLRKTRVMKTITWYPATCTELSGLHSRIPTYVIPQHIALTEVTDVELQ